MPCRLARGGNAMRRREFIAQVGSLVAVWPLKAEAQREPRTIAIVGHTAAEYGPWAAALVERLGQLGWIEGRTIQIEYHWSEGRPERVAEIASELVRQKVDIIVTYGSAAITLKQATASIPIVFAPAIDPVGTGLVASLSRPGGNITGMSFQQAEIGSKKLELLREIDPSLGTLGILYDATYPASAREAENVQTAARQLGLGAMPRGVQKAEDIAPAISDFKGQVSAIYLVENALLDRNRTRLMALALDAKVPVASTSSEFAKAGALVSYGPNYADLFRRAAEMVDKILRGTKPSEIPVEQPTKFDLVINVRTANALGITVPHNLLVLADEVIE
jgi:putative tryptophan/tyrosine transport system substrate-binding protein